MKKLSKILGIASKLPIIGDACEIVQFINEYYANES